MYVKAPKVIVEYLAAVFGYDHRYETSNDRQIFPDGNYMLWERDFLPFCSSEELSAKLPELGCVALTAQQVRAEQDGLEVNELPPITDERLLDFIGPTDTTTPDADVTPDGDAGTDADADSDSSNAETDAVAEEEEIPASGNTIEEEGDA